MRKLFHFTWVECALFILMLMTVSASDVFAQVTKLEVDNFVLMDKDTDASINYPLEDWNGNTCAIIKIKTDERGFVFDTGTISITKVDYRNGEVWVYVSEGVRKLNVSHGDYGVCRYEIPIPVKRGSVYRMTIRLTVPQSKGIFVQTATIESGYLKLKITPAQSIVRLGRTAEYELDAKVTSDGTYAKMLDYGKYYYCVESDLYEPYHGQIDFGKTTERQNVSLRPAYNMLSIQSVPEAGASIIIKGIDVSDEMTGVTPFSSDRKFRKGTYKVMMTRDEYAPFETQITLSGDGTLKSFSFDMKPQFAVVTCTCPMAEAEIWIDNEYKGKGSWSGRLWEGMTHHVEARLANHHTRSKSFSVTKGQNLNITVEAPLAQVATLDISSDPTFAKVNIDGKFFGEAPFVKELPIGKHVMEVSADGYDSVAYDIEVEEGQTYMFKAVLNKSVAPARPAYSSNSGSSSYSSNSGNSGSSYSSGSGSGRNKTVTVGGYAFEMVYVEGGSYTDGERVSRSVSDYYIGKYEVTQELWVAVMGSNPQYKSQQHQGHAIGMVTYYDCEKFVAKLNQMTGLEFSIPTAAQWEFAALGGNKSQGYKYSGSNDLSEVAWHQGNSDGKDHKVGTRKPNELGIYDMSGNMMEWCSDTYDGKKQSRGGAYCNGEWPAKCLQRYQTDPSAQYNSYSLRLVLKASSSSSSGTSDYTYTSRYSGGHPLSSGSSPTKTVTVNGYSFDMVYVAGGSYRDSEGSTKSVSGYYIGKYEVTQELWEAVMGNNPLYNHLKKAGHPIAMVNYSDCEAFITQLNRKTGLSFSIPTVAQWEFASLGGNKSRGYKYSGSNDLSEVAWYEDNSGSKAQKVGTKAPNELGIYDMSGNIAEWCSDYYKDNRSIRGGSYCNGEWPAKSLQKYSNGEELKYPSYGLRLVLNDSSSSSSSSSYSSGGYTYTSKRGGGKFAGTSVSKFFPVYGLTIGECTLKDVRDKGYDVDEKTYSSPCADVADLDLWDHDHDGIFESIYIVNFNSMPQEWLNMGFNWGLSYNQLVQKFRGWGYSIVVNKEPKTDSYDGRRTLSAEITATSSDGLISFNLTFNYGNRKGEGYSKDSYNSLYSISIKVKP